MAYTAADLDRIDGVIGRGEKTVQFSDRSVTEDAIAIGWMSIVKGKLTIHQLPDEVDGKEVAREDVVFSILRSPGGYCCHCQMPLGKNNDSKQEAKNAQAHVAELHEDADSPDPENAAGYHVINYYDCRKEAS